MTPALLDVYLGAIRPRLLERPLWRYRHRHGLSELPAAGLRRRLPGGDDRGVLACFAEGYARRFPHVLGRREAFQAELAGHPEHVGALLAAAERSDGLVFDVLGSGPVSLGPAIDWHRDFKSGHAWPLDVAWRMDYTNLDTPSDVKVPWELSRFHAAAWLGQAYWITGEERWAARFRSLLESWWEANPPGRGINWAVPMELAIRAANWIMAFGWFHGSPSLDEAFWLRLLGSLWRHGEVIRGNLEYQRRLGNHYIANAMGLVLLGVCFRDSRTGRAWLRDGHRILEREMRRQVHPDGVDYEKSVSYHRLVLECFYLGFVRGEAAGLRFSHGFRARLARMFDFTAAYTRPDGTTPLVSDADDGRVWRPAPADAITDHRHALAVGAALFGASRLAAEPPRWHAEALWLLGPGAQAAPPPATPGLPAPRSCAFPNAGYYVMRGTDTHTFLDAGEIGFAGDSGHGHNDTLSFELYAPGGTFIVDSGTYLYTSDPAAHRAFAGTRAHNTLVVDGREIAEFAGLWRLAADTTAPRVLEWSAGEDEDRWAAEHYGYRRLAQPVVHRRAVRFERTARRWTVRDSVTGRGRHSAELFLHLHPDAAVRQVTEREVDVRLESGALSIACSEAITIESGWVAPSYGVRRPASVLKAALEGPVPLEIVTTIQWRHPGEGRPEGDRP